MGARVAAKKCYVWSSCEVAKRWMREHTWRRLEEKVRLVPDIRDLGAHLNLTENMRVATTLTARMRKTAAAAERLKFKKAPFGKKAQIVRAKLLTKGL